MAGRMRGQPLEAWEVGIVKAMLDEGSRTHQDILAYFTRPTRSVNHRVISEIEGKKKFPGVAAAHPRSWRPISRLGPTSTPRRVSAPEAMNC